MLLQTAKFVHVVRKAQVSQEVWFGINIGGSSAFGHGLKFSLSDILPYRPLIVIGGSSDRDQESKGAFQEFPQVIIFYYI